MNATTPDIGAIWEEITVTAKAVATKEPLLLPVLRETVLERRDFADGLAHRLGRKLGNHATDGTVVRRIFEQVLSEDEAISENVAADVLAVRDRDPACSDLLTPLLYFKGFQALTAYRVSHHLFNEGRSELALYLQSLIAETFSVDIHPAARIGKGILLDHATSFVAGETSVIADDVSILHEVTLGGTGKDRGDRHPKVQYGVLLGAGAKILGNVTIGEGARVGAGSVVLNDVPPHVTVAGVPAKIVGKNTDENPSLKMDHTLRYK